MGLPGKSGGVVFSPVPCKVVCYEPEKVGVSFLRASVQGPAPIRADLQHVCKAASSMETLLERAMAYVERVMVRNVLETIEMCCFH